MKRNEKKLFAIGDGNCLLEELVERQSAGPCDFSIGEGEQVWEAGRIRTKAMGVGGPGSAMWPSRTTCHCGVSTLMPCHVLPP